MITGYAFALVLCAMLVALLFVLLRTRRLREKYAGIWILVSLGVVLLAVFPAWAFWLARMARVYTPANLLFAGAIAVLLLVCIHLSTELSSMEEETRTLTEEIALLRLEVRSLRDEVNQPAPVEPMSVANPVPTPVVPEPRSSSLAEIP
jgi:hypothetical protein